MKDMSAANRDLRGRIKVSRRKSRKSATFNPTFPPLRRPSFDMLYFITLIFIFLCTFFFLRHFMSWVFAVLKTIPLELRHISWFCEISRVKINENTPRRKNALKTMESRELSDLSLCRSSQADSGSVDLETPLEQSPKSPKSPLEQSPKSPLEVLDEALDRVMPSTFSLPVAPPRGKQKRGMTSSKNKRLSFIALLS